MAEKAEPAETLKPQLMRRIKNVRGYFWSVFPWPEQFYEREENLEPIASDLMVSVASIIIFVLCGAAFGYTYMFFSDPSQDTVDRIVSAQTAIDGYTCRPMGPDKWYDLDWTHDECESKLRPITVDTIDWPEDADSIDDTFECPFGAKIIYRPFGDYQRRNGIAPKSAEKRTLMGTIDYPAAEALGGDCPEPQYSPMDGGSPECWEFMAAKAKVDDADGVIMECMWGSVSLSKDWAVEHMKNIAAHFYTDLCDFTLSNVPYECIKMVPTDSMTILALATNNAALVYTVVAIVFGLFLKVLTKLRIDPGGNSPPREAGPKVHWVRKLPLPASLFYDEPAELDFIDNDLVIGVSTFAVVSVAAACFAVFWGYYAGDEHDSLDVQFGSQWNVPGYECTPLQFEEEWGTNFSYAKCLTSLRPIEADVSVIFEDNGEAKYVPFDSSTEGVSGVAWGKFDEPEFIDEADFCTKRDSFPQWHADANIYGFSGTDFDWESTEYEIGSGRIYPKQVCECGFESCPQETIPYTWTDDKKAEAVEVWKQLLALLGDKICDFTKTNAPFSCTKTEPMDLPTRFSLAYGNAMLIFASACAVVAVLIRRRQKLCSFGKLKVADVKNSLRSTTVGKYISIPSNFYHEDVMELVAPPMATLFGFILWLAAFIASFVYLYQFYASKTTVETTFISGTSKEGASCKPIRPHTYYKLDWSYDECMARKEPPSFANTRLVVSSAMCRRCDEREHICNNKTEWGFRPWGADGPTFRYMKNESTSGLLTLLDTFETEFNAKWNNDAGCNAGCGVYSWGASPHCPEVQLDNGGFLGLYQSHGSHRIWFKRYGRFGESFDYDETAFTDWGLFVKLGEIYDYLVQNDELCKWTLENVPYSCEETVKMTTLEAVSLAFANAELIGIGTGIAVGFLVKSFSKGLKKRDSKDAAVAGLGFAAAAVSATALT